VRWVYAQVERGSIAHKEEEGPKPSYFSRYLSLRFINDSELFRRSLGHRSRPKTVASLATSSLDQKEKRAGPGEAAAGRGRTRGVGATRREWRPAVSSAPAWLSCLGRRRMTSCGTTQSLTPGPIPRATPSTK
jgi:hypothetical protein